MSMVDSYHAQGYNAHRKALPPGANVHLPPRTQSPLVSIDPNPQHAVRSSTMTAHAYTQQQAYSRPTNTNPISHQAYMNQYNPTARRTLSNATTSTSSTGNGGIGGGPARANSTSSSQLQRSTSSRSGSSPSSYVALMRKQKATVWCDRAQQEDPRLLAAQRAAKQRAFNEISSSSHHHHHHSHTSSYNRSGTLGGVRSKMRGHHGAIKASQYGPGLHSASGVPMRLSANEVDDDDDVDRVSDEDGRRALTMSGQGQREQAGRWGGYGHTRTESARSSLGSARGVSGQYAAGTVTPPAASTGQVNSPGQQYTTDDHTTTAHNSAQSPSSSLSFYSSSGTPSSRPPMPQERDSDDTDHENSFGGVGGLPSRFGQAPQYNQMQSYSQSQPQTYGQGHTQNTGGWLGDDLNTSNQNLDDLKRRGSVDERTTTMTGYGRLFVANPDLD